MGLSLFAALPGAEFALLALGIVLLGASALIVRVNRLLLPALLALTGFGAIAAWNVARESPAPPSPGIRLAQGAADLPSPVRDVPPPDRTPPMADLAPVHTLSWPGEEIYATALDRAGRWAALARSSGLALVDLESGEEVASLPTDRQGDARVRSLTFAPDGLHLAAGFTGRIEYLRVPTLERVYELRFRSPLGGRAEVSDLAISPSGEVLAATSGTEVVFHDLRSGGAIGSLRPDDRGIDRLAWSADGRLLAAIGSGRRSLVAWRTAALAGLGERGALCRVELAGDTWFDAAGFGRGGETLVALVASGREPTRLSTWNLDDCRLELDEPIGHRRTHGLALSPDRTEALVLGPGDEIRAIRLTDGETAGTLEAPPAGGAPSWSEDGRRLLLTSYAEDEVTIYERR